MEGGLLSLKWNNHKSTFFHVLSNVRKKKDSYSDATLACDGKFYPVHKLVLSSCSDYFEEMFDQAGQAQCKHPFIVLKDIKCDELECLLSYMYVGEVNVVQEKLAGLIKAAECLRIKGLAVPDEEPSNSSNKSSREKRQSDNSVNSEPKRRRHEDTNSTPNSRQQINRIEERRKQFNDSSIGSNKLKAPSSSVDNAETADSRTKENEDSEIVKNESFLDDNDVPEEILLDDPPQDQVKAEPPEDLDLYHAESNSIPGDKEELLSDGYGDNTTESQQHFMDDLLGNSSDAGHLGALGDFARDGGESSSHVGGSQQSMMSHHIGNSHKALKLPSTIQTVECDLGTILPGIEPFDSQLPVTSQENEIGSRAFLMATLPFEVIVDSSKILDEFKIMRYKCPVCHKTLRDQTRFRTHYAHHTGERSFRCSYCPYRTISSELLKKHVKRKHCQDGYEITEPALL